MKITRIQATPLHLPVTVEINGRAKTTSLSMCLVDIETDTGLIGTGLTAITEEEVIGSIINEIAAHALIGMDPLRHEQIWERLYWLLTPRGQSGYASHAVKSWCPHTEIPGIFKKVRKRYSPLMCHSMR